MIVLILILLPILVLNMFVMSKAIKDETGKYQKISNWLDVCFKLTVVSYLYMLILKYNQPSIRVSVILLIISMASVIADFPIKTFQKQKYAPYRLGVSLISFAILAVYAIATFI